MNGKTDALPTTFQDSLPGYAREWLWLPHQTVTLTLPMPGGEWYAFNVRYCPQERQLANNITVCRPVET